MSHSKGAFIICEEGWAMRKLKGVE